MIRCFFVRLKTFPIVIDGIINRELFCIFENAMYLLQRDTCVGSQCNIKEKNLCQINCELHYYPENYF